MLSEEWGTALNSLSREDKYHVITFLLQCLKEEESPAIPIELDLTFQVSNEEDDDFEDEDDDFEDEDEDDDDEPYDEVASSPEDDKIVARWLPRLQDRSSDVRENAADKIATVAARNTSHRDNIVPILLTHARTEEDWCVICEGILFPLYRLPKHDPQWVDSFLDLYIYLAQKAEYVTSEHAYRYIWKLIEEDVVDKQNSKFDAIIKLAKKGEKSKNSDIRSNSLSILDWLEDS